jgi:hypothetical protein
MQSHLDHYTNILRYWRSVETFNLPDVRPGKADAIETELKPGIPLPWEDPQFPEPAENRRWKHTLYFHLVEKEAVIALLARLTGSTEYRDPVGGKTCMSALVLDQAGRPNVRSYAPVAFVYAIKLIRKRQNPELLSEELKQAQESYTTRFELGAHEEPVPITWPLLQKELTYLHQFTTGDWPATVPLLCVSELTSPAATPDAPFLNSYYIQDLDTLIRHPQHLGAPLRRLLAPQVHPASPQTQPEPSQIHTAARQDLLDPRNLLTHIHPRSLPPGRWPANPAHGLYSAQLAALNITLSSDIPIIGINGPPGTGKTTLLREVIAHVIVTRAKRLLKADPDNLFSAKRLPIHEKAGYYPIDESILGNDGIVVAGSNNTAIENISRELPQLRSVDRAAFPEVDYFSGVASNIFGGPAWGLVSAVLGRSDNRNAFIEKFWFHKGRNFNRYLREQADQVDEARAHFAQTAAGLTGLLKEFGHFQELASTYHDGLLAGEANSRSHTQGAGHATLAHRLHSEYAIPTANLPGPGFTTLPMASIHRLTPYSSEKLNTLRSTIFLRSLELHEWAIRANAPSFRTNLGAFVDMLAGRYREHIDESVASILWSSFFFCVPVVSVTLASFHRQFERLGSGAPGGLGSHVPAGFGSGALGWLLLDEAGQATLPSIAGALWRAQRSIFIGDTRQIAPVVNIPQALDKLLRENYGLTEEWSPLYHSAQSLADRITPIGSYIDNTWTGIPLRAHRRCDEPMFTIANTIAYNGQMVRIDQPAAIPNQPTAIPNRSVGQPAIIQSAFKATAGDAPPSSWLDVRGFTVIEGHALHEEGTATKTLLQQLVTHEGKIFIISPFRSVAGSCRDQFEKRGRIECGTIHTFQGREADMVILVLGTLPKSKKARDWVAATPNILNVAITRARHRLYVIGNRQTWSAHRYFDYLARALPPVPLTA